MNKLIELLDPDFDDANDQYLAYLQSLPTSRLTYGEYLDLLELSK